MKLILCAAVLFLSQKAFSWGPQGHSVVAQVAENNLTPNAKASVRRILQNASLVDVANWADTIRNDPQWNHTSTWHYVTIEDGDNYSNSEHAHEGDVVSAITEMVKILKDQKSPASDKQNALKFIVHFVGDVHQPLHVGRGDDRGGNEIRLTFEGKTSNLHALWDTLMIRKVAMDTAQYATYLESQSLAPEPYDLAALKFSQIIRECMDARNQVYDFRGLVDGPIKLEAAYFNKNLSLMNQQLLSGGKRLAALLNEIYK